MNANFNLDAFVPVSSFDDLEPNAYFMGERPAMSDPLPNVTSFQLPCFGGLRRLSRDDLMKNKNLSKFSVMSEDPVQKDLLLQLKTDTQLKE